MRSRRSSWPRTAMCLGVVAVSLALLAACGDEEEDQTQSGNSSRDGGDSEDNSPVTAIPVRAEPVVREDLFTHLETYARLEAERQVTVRARMTGLVERLHVEEGDKVKPGQVLVELEQEEASLQLRQSRAEYEEAKASFERSQHLRQNEMVSLAEFEATRLRYEISKVGLEKAEIGLAHTTIRAPLGGVITRRFVERGDLVNGNQRICVIADLDLLLARVFIPERGMYQVQPGQSATISVPALPDRTFASRIHMISPEVIPESGTVKVTLQVLGSEQLRPGMFATVRLVTGRRPSTLVIPKRALVLETEEDDVFAIVDSKARKVPVELGLIEGDHVEVLSGVAEGDMLVTVGHKGLKEGTLVRIVGSAPNEEAGEASP